jgi:hypothetical protein
MTMNSWDKCVCGHAFDLHDKEQREYCIGLNRVEYDNAAMARTEITYFPCQCILFKKHSGTPYYGDDDLT